MILSTMKRTKLGPMSLPLTKRDWLSVNTSRSYTRRENIWKIVRKIYINILINSKKWQTDRRKNTQDTTMAFSKSYKFRWKPHRISCWIKKGKGSKLSIKNTNKFKTNTRGSNNKWESWPAFGKWSQTSLFVKSLDMMKICTLLIKILVNLNCHLFKFYSIGMKNSKHLSRSLIETFRLNCWLQKILSKKTKRRKKQPRGKQRKPRGKQRKPRGKQNKKNLNTCSLDTIPMLKWNLMEGIPTIAKKQ